MKDWLKLTKSFDEMVLRTTPSRSSQELATLEQELESPIPQPLRYFLEQTNGIGMIDFSILGTDDIIQQTRWHRERMLRQRDEYWDSLEPTERTPESEIVVSRDGSGDTCAIIQQGIVARFDHETGKVMWIVASSFDHFLWFVLDDYKRRVRLDGSEKPGYWRSRRWPYTDLPWMLKQDPGLSLYRSE